MEGFVISYSVEVPVFNSSFSVNDVTVVRMMDVLWPKLSAVDRGRLTRTRGMMYLYRYLLPVHT